MSTREGAPHIYLANPDGTDIRRLTNATQSESAPAWSPDGARLAFNSGDGNTYVINRDGSGLTRIPNGGGWPSWSPDGSRLLVGTEDGFRIVAADGSSGNETVIRLDPNGFTGFFSQGVQAPWGGEWSPDGSRIAFGAWTGWDFERAFVVNVDGSNGRAFVYPGNAVWDECTPVWSPDGSRIALLSGVHGFAVVDMATGTPTSVMHAGTMCWDEGGVSWSPDGSMLALTKRDPPWVQGLPMPANQTVSVVIIELETRIIRATIPDAYEPDWSRDE